MCISDIEGERIDSSIYICHNMMYAHLSILHTLKCPSEVMESQFLAPNWMPGVENVKYEYRVCLTFLDRDTPQIQWLCTTKLALFVSLEEHLCLSPSMC